MFELDFLESDENAAFYIKILGEAVVMKKVGARRNM